VKKQVEPKIVLLVGSIFLVYLIPIAFVDGAKFQSGVTINAPSPNGTCPGPDENGDGVDDMTGEPCPAPTGPAAGTCGLSIVSGVPINYGQLNLGQDSAEQEVTVTNEGTSQTPAKIMIKGGDWISDAEADPDPALINPAISGPEITHVAIAPNLDWSNKKALSLGGWELGQISAGQTIPIYFQFKVPINAPSGSFHQDVTIDLLC
jgi:hypothetical protein